MRKERDSMGDVELPENALYGASTRRAIENFPISGLRFPRVFIRALGLLKLCAARANLRLKLLQDEVGRAIIQAASEVAEGKHDEHFVVDVFQTGSGTSTNMNVNEVIANRAALILGGRGQVHPNDHVNLCQSSNDVFPSAIHVAAADSIAEKLMPALEVLASALESKADEFGLVIKAGRTHLQDATPVTLGQEMGGYARQIRLAMERIGHGLVHLRELPLGGTAVGTGINAPSSFAKMAIEELNSLTGLSFVEAIDHFEAQGAKDSLVALSGHLRTAAISLLKIANDVRWMASGPGCGLGEIELPAVQPGSSIMPAKVNPVIAESAMMAAAQILGSDTVVSICAQHGNLELNVMMPAVAYNILLSIDLLSSSSRNFATRCVSGIKANRERCKELAEKSFAICTALAPRLGYDRTAELAKKALAENKPIRQVALETGVLSEEELDSVLDLMKMAGVRS